MKLLVKFAAIIAMLFTMTLVANAQGKGQSLSPEEKAEKFTNKLTEKVNLDRAQVPKVKAIALEYAHKMQEAREANQGDKEAIKEIRKEIRKEKRAALKEVLTDEQIAILKELKRERKEGRKDNGRERQRGR